MLRQPVPEFIEGQQPNLANRWKKENIAIFYADI